MLLAAALATASRAQPAPPPPPWGPVLHAYINFPVGSAQRLTPPGLDPIEQMAPTIPADAYVAVDGKTDTLGDAEDNLALSLRRARAAADELVVRGVDPARIFLRACGERDLNRPTPDGTSEPLNRSAYFDWRSTPWPPSLTCDQSPYAPAS